MVPSRGLRPAHFTPFTSRQSLHLRSNVARQFSSIPRSTALPTASRRTSPLQSSNWTSRPSNHHNVILNASAVRYGSWYAPWSWGRSSTPSPDAAPSTTSSSSSDPSTLVQTREPLASEPTVTTATPELAPAGIDKAPVLESTTASQPAQGSVEEVVESVLNNGVPLNGVVNPAAAIEKVGALKEMGLDFGWGPTALFEWCLEHVYIYSGWGWGASILACTVLVRTFGFWFQLRGSDNMAKMAAVNPVLRDVQAQMTEAIKNRDEAKTKALRREQMDVYKKVGVSPISGMLPLFVQGAFGFGAFRCIRNMASLPVPGLSEGGFLWFTDLTVHDPYFVLPLASAAVFHIMMKYGGETGASNQTMAPGARLFMQNFLPMIMAAFTGWLSAGIQLYLLFSTILGTFTARLLRNSAFRRRWNLAPLPSPESQAYWSKVLKDGTPLDKAILTTATPKSPLSQAQKPAYQPPRGVQPRIQNRGLNLKASASIPAHLRAQEEVAPFADRDHDYEKVPDGMWDKVDWIRRNYKPKYVWMRMKISAAKWSGRKDLIDMVTREQGDIAKRKAAEYEWRRRQRFNQK